MTPVRDLWPSGLGTYWSGIEIPFVISVVLSKVDISRVCLSLYSTGSALQCQEMLYASYVGADDVAGLF